MTQSLKIVMTVAFTTLAAAAIFIALTLYVSSTEDPCIDSGSFANYQACQTMDRILEGCDQFAGTDLQAQCIASQLR
jgi:hypothetical protein